MNKRQAKVLRHCLGLNADGSGIPYRNHFCAGGEDEVICRELIAIGFMQQHKTTDLVSVLQLFCDRCRKTRGQRACGCKITFGCDLGRVCHPNSMAFDCGGFVETEIQGIIKGFRYKAYDSVAYGRECFCDVKAQDMIALLDHVQELGEIVEGLMGGDNIAVSRAVKYLNSKV